MLQSICGFIQSLDVLVGKIFNKLNWVQSEEPWHDLKGWISWDVLFQHLAPNQKVYPCAFSWSPEIHSDVESCKLLAVKLAQEEWRHRLDGASSPFIVWNDHKNSAYDQPSKFKFILTQGSN